MLCKTLHFGEVLRLNLTLEEGVECLNALELKLNVSVVCELICVNYPLAVVNNKVCADLTLGNIGAERTYLVDSVSLLKLLCKVGYIGCNDLDKRDRSTEENFIGKNFVSCRHKNQSFLL